jgi:hypothetical protein
VPDTVSTLGAHKPADDEKTAEALAHLNDFVNHTPDMGIGGKLDLRNSFISIDAANDRNLFRGERPNLRSRSFDTFEMRPLNLARLAA